MPDETTKLHHPWLVAVWPGMGNVALTAGYYLMAKLGMHILAEYAPGELFDVEHVEVKMGLIRSGRLPRSRLFLWNDPNRRHDLIVFIGEAQPPLGKYMFCQRLIEYAKQLNIERVLTFAAMATQMHPEQESRVFAAATDNETLKELRRLNLEILNDGQIGGLNGVLLGVAAEHHMRGACLLGEMPQIFSQLPFPKASLSVLHTFTAVTGIQLDFSELQEQADMMEEQLGQLLNQVEEAFEEGESELEEESFGPAAGEPPETRELSREELQRIEELFQQAEKNRSKAYELKRELDTLGVFKEYEDRFLDLFKKS